jgi:hypothetical protein
MGTAWYLYRSVNTQKIIIKELKTVCINKTVSNRTVRKILKCRKFPYCKNTFYMLEKERESDLGYPKVGEKGQF